VQDVAFLRRMPARRIDITGGWAMVGAQPGGSPCFVR
jgi:hypothetical protein